MIQRTTVVVDAYGGQQAPAAQVRAAARVARKGLCDVVLVGDVAALQDQLTLVPYDPMTLRLVAGGTATPRRPGDAASQQEAVRGGLAVALDMVRRGEAHALVTPSPLSWVQTLVGAQLPGWPGLIAPAAASVVPTVPRDGQDPPLSLLLDVSGRRSTGATALVQHAVLGATYARVVHGVAQPSVALLSTGPLPSDGPPEVVQAHQLLKQQAGIRFAGNLQACDLSRGRADVVVTDGLVGHTVHGLLEGLTDLTVEAARYAWRTKMTWRVGLRLLSQGVGVLRKASEFRDYGGVPLLGLQDLVLVTGGDGREPALEHAIGLAATCHQRGLQPALAKAMAQWQASAGVAP